MFWERNPVKIAWTWKREEKPYQQFMWYPQKYSEITESVRHSSKCFGRETQLKLHELENAKKNPYQQFMWYQQKYSEITESVIHFLNVFGETQLKLHELENAKKNPCVTIDNFMQYPLKTDSTKVPHWIRNLCAELNIFTYFWINQISLRSEHIQVRLELLLKTYDHRLFLSNKTVNILHTQKHLWLHSLKV